MEMETDTALGIAKSMCEDLEQLERWWPVSKRGSNAQRVLDSISSKRNALEQCLLDAMK